MPLSSTQGVDLLEHRIHKDSSTFVLHAVVEVRISCPRPASCALLILSWWQPSQLLILTQGPGEGLQKSPL